MGQSMTSEQRTFIQRADAKAARQQRKAAYILRQASDDLLRKAEMLERGDRVAPIGFIIADLTVAQLRLGESEALMDLRYWVEPEDGSL